MIILKGKAIAEKILENLKKEIHKNGLSLRLSVILVGKDPSSLAFIRQKQRACLNIGVRFELFNLPSGISRGDFENQIRKISRRSKNQGLIIQLPLPPALRKGDQKFLNLIPFDQDVDILSEYNLGRFHSGFLPVLPPVVGAIFHILRKYRIETKGKNVLVVGAGRLVGFPLAIQLLREKATVSVINEFTKNIFSFTKKADVIITGVGKPGLIRGSMVKKGVAIIDAGTSFRQGKLAGDVDFESVKKKAKYITPVPGGVGPLTVACLLENLVKIKKTKNG